MADQHLHADARQGIRAKARPGERAGDSHRRAVGRRAARAGALRMRVIVRVQPLDLHPDAAHFIAEHFFPVGSDDDGRHRMHNRQVDMGIVGRGQRHAAPHARERVLVAPVVFIAWLAVHVGRHRVEQHAACREQRLCALVQFLRQVVPYTVMKRRDDELPLLGRQCVELRMLGKRKPMADGQVAHIAHAVDGFRAQFVRKHAILADPVEIGRRISARGISMTLSASKCPRSLPPSPGRRSSPVRFATSGRSCNPMSAGRSCRNQASARRPQRDRVALFGGGITVIANGTGNRLGQLHRIVGEDQRMNRRVVRVAVRPLAGLACLDEDSRAVAPQQPPDEVRVRLVDLPREFTRRVTFALQAGQVEFECARQRRTALAPLWSSTARMSGRFLVRNSRELVRRSITDSTSRIVNW